MASRILRAVQSERATRGNTDLDATGLPEASPLSALDGDLTYTGVALADFARSNPEHFVGD